MYYREPFDSKDKREGKLKLSDLMTTVYRLKLYPSGLHKFHVHKYS